MINVYLYCEGQTEESFVINVLQLKFAQKGIYITPIICTTKRNGIGKRGGGTVPYRKMKSEIKNLCANKNFYVTTMFDFYALPSDIPGRLNPLGNTMYEKVKYVESEWGKDISEGNFIPNIVMHEFEGLLFSEPKKFAYVDSRQMNLKEIAAIREKFETPEHINDSVDTAPSKRILKIYPEYDKVLHGTQIAIDIGLDGIMNQCRHFNEWICKIENLNV